MLFKVLNEPSKSIPTGLALLVVGLLMITCSTAWQHVFAPILHLSPEMNDFARGFCIGLGLTLEVCALPLLVWSARNKAV